MPLRNQQHDERERRVDKKNRAPGNMFDQSPAVDRHGSGSYGRKPRPCSDCLSTPLLIERRADDGKASRHKQRAGYTLRRARDNQLIDASCHSAPYRSQREERNAGAEDASSAAAVADGSTGQKQRGKKERVRFHDPLQVQNRSVETLLERGQCHINDCSIDKSHARPQNGGGQNPGLGHRRAWKAGRSCSNDAFVARLDENIHHVSIRCS